MFPIARKFQNIIIARQNTDIVINLLCFLKSYNNSYKNIPILNTIITIIAKINVAL